MPTGPDGSTDEQAEASAAEGRVAKADAEGQDGRPPAVDRDAGGARVDRSGFTAVLWCPFDDAVRILSGWLGTGTFRIQDRLAGMEAVHDGPTAYVFCHEATGKMQACLVEGAIPEAMADAEARLRPLLEIANAARADIQLEYSAMGPRGHRDGDERSLA